MALCPDIDLAVMSISEEVGGCCVRGVVFRLRVDLIIPDVGTSTKNSFYYGRTAIRG